MLYVISPPSFHYSLTCVEYKSYSQLYINYNYILSIIYYIYCIPFFWPYDGSLWNTNMESNIFPFLLHIGCINHVLTKMISDNLFFYLHLASHYTY